MTDAHCHISCGDSSIREFLIGRDFIGLHPWDIPEDASIFADYLNKMREMLKNNENLGVGEIGLDRLKKRDILSHEISAFESQLKLAIEFRRPVILHGAKCWGRVVSIIRSFAGVDKLPSMVFHGFSRSDGLIPEIVQLGGYISVGPAILNDHAINYRELVKKIPLDRLLIETDRTEENAAECPSIISVAQKLAELRGTSAADLESIIDTNAKVIYKSC